MSKHIHIRVEDEELYGFIDGWRVSHGYSWKYLVLMGLFNEIHFDEPGLANEILNFLENRKPAGRPKEQ